MQLALLGNAYWSILAKTINVWRTPGFAKSLHAAWLRLFGKDRAHIVAGRLPQRALTGRWGSGTASENFLLKAGPTELRQAWQLGVVERMERLHTAAKGDTGDDDHDLPLGDMGEDFVQIRSRWIRESTQGLINNFQRACCSTIVECQQT